MNHASSFSRRRGFGLVELLIIVAVIGLLVWVMSGALTGTGGKPGVVEQARQVKAQVDLYGMYQGFFTYATANDSRYPSTKVDSRMSDDTTSQVFNLLVSDGYLAAQQLISPNECVSEFGIGAPGNIGPTNVSWALPDYDANNWQRESQWQADQNPTHILISDRWVEAESFPGMHNLQQESENDPGFWNLLLNDGSSKTIASPELNGDRIFEDGSGRDDLWMVHD